MNLKRVVITGLGTINPLGHNVPEFWDNLIKGVSGAAMHRSSARSLPVK